MADVATKTETYGEKVERMRALLGERQAFIVLAREPGANAWRGLIENSFSMDWSDDRVRLWCTGTYYSFLGEHQIDGHEDAEAQLKHYRTKHPTWELAAFDARAPECPVSIDWEKWFGANASNSKFGSRNAVFEIKDDDAPCSVTQAEPSDDR